MAGRGHENLSRWTPGTLRQEALVQQAPEPSTLPPYGTEGGLMLSRRTVTMLRTKGPGLPRGPPLAAGAIRLQFPRSGEPSPAWHCPGMRQ